MFTEDVDRHTCTNHPLWSSALLSDSLPLSSTAPCLLQQPHHPLLPSESKMHDEIKMNNMKYQSIKITVIIALMCLYPQLKLYKRYL